MDGNEDALLGIIDRLGEIIFEDDKNDFPRFAFPGHPSPIHHWQLGLVMRGVAKLGRAMSEIMTLADAFADEPLDVFEAAQQLGLR